MPQSAEVFSPHRLRSLDLHADDIAGRVLQNDIDFHLVAVTVMKELHWLIAPGELSRNLADDEGLQQPGNLPHAGLHVSDLPLCT